MFQCAVCQKPLSTHGFFGVATYTTATGTSSSNTPVIGITCEIPSKEIGIREYVPNLNYQTYNEVCGPDCVDVLISQYFETVRKFIKQVNPKGR